LLFWLIAARAGAPASPSSDTSDRFKWGVVVAWRIALPVQLAVVQPRFAEVFAHPGRTSRKASIQ